MNNFSGHAHAVDEEELLLAPIGTGELGSMARQRTADHSAKYRAPILLNALRLSDFAALLIAGYGGYFLRFGFGSSVSSSSHLFIYLSTIVTVVSLHMTQGYRIRSLGSLYALLNTLFVGGAGALTLILFCGYLSRTLHEYSRAWLIFSVIGATALLSLNRIVVTQVVQRAIRTNKLTESVVVVGANEHAEKLIEAVQNSAHSNVKVLGVFDDRVQRQFPASLSPRMLGSTNELLHYIRCNRVDRVVVALPWISSDRIDGLLKKLGTVPVRIDLVPNDVIWKFPTINMERLGSVPILTVANGRLDDQSGIIKRTEDLVISTVLLLLLTPLLLLIALAIKLESKGPVIFRQRRHGFNNDVFEVYKFRSMTVADCTKTEVVQAIRDDRRVTRVGKLLRRSSLDELPQLFNVLLGHMSIVGPRPHAVQHNIEFGSLISEYFARHNVKPGITGWAQVNGFRGETDTLDKMHRRVEYDLHYIENWSLLLDLRIILMTTTAIWFDANAY